MLQSSFLKKGQEEGREGDKRRKCRIVIIGKPKGIRSLINIQLSNYLLPINPQNRASTRIHGGLHRQSKSHPRLLLLGNKNIPLAFQPHKRELLESVHAVKKVSSRHMIPQSFQNLHRSESSLLVWMKEAHGDGKDAALVFRDAAEDLIYSLVGGCCGVEGVKDFRGGKMA